MATTKDRIPGQLIKCGDLTSTIKQYSTELKKPDIEELEAEITRLKAEIKKRKKSEEVLKAFLENTISSVAILDRNYNFIRVNERYAKADCRNVSDFPGHNHFEFYPSDAKEIFDNVVRTKESYKVLARPFVFPDHPEWGPTYWDWTLVPVLDSSGEIELLILTLNDVTEHVRVQEKLLESEERYRSIFDNSIDGILLAISDGTILSANPSACRMFGRTEEELCAVYKNGAVDLDDPRVMMAIRESAKTGRIKTEATLIRKDGTKFLSGVTSSLFKDKSGRLLSSIIVRDITERKKSEEASRLSEEKFSKAFYHNQTPMAISRLNEGVLIDLNNSYAEVLGYNREEMIGKRVSELEIWADPKERQGMINQLSENGYIRNFESKHRKKSGEIGYALSTLSILDMDRENCLLISSVDITERKKTEEALRQSEERFFKAYNANPLSMAIISIKDGTFMDINESFLKRNGYNKEEIIGFRATDIVYFLDLVERSKFLKEINLKGYADNLEIRFRKKSGEIAIGLLSGVTIDLNGEECILAISNDITELRRYQNDMARLDRLNMIGEMAAGIGHEVRNPMTTIKGFLQLLKEKDRYAQDKDYMDLMIEELDRANSIITEFLSLAKNKAVELKMQSLNQKIRVIFPLIQADALKQDKNIEIELGDIPNVIIDKNEIQQLILNLVRNGLEAMLPGGLLTIKTFLEGDSVVLAVKDQGKGIASEVLEKIGTPFFTTKDNGTGLGLAVCYSIAARHNARINIETGSEGTTFFVRFKG